MKFILNGQNYQIPDLGNEELSKAFINLHESFFGPRAMDWPQFIRAAISFFDENVGGFSKHDEYFNSFTIIWKTLLESRSLEKAEIIWQDALKPALQWEKENPNHRIHKGTPYYFWGMTTLVKGSLDLGYSLIHQSCK